MIYLITYNLQASDKDYDALYDKIKAEGDWFHALESTWFVTSNHEADELSSSLRTEMDDNDSLLVVNITRQDRQGWLSKNAWEWINSHEEQ